ncbi:replication/maintenance protein RepL [Sulfurimonas sp.]
MKVKYAGRKTFYDENGNPIEMDIIQKHYDTIDKRRWRRVVLADFLEVLEQIGNKKIKVLEYLIDNMNSNNEIDLTQDEIAEATGISKKTVNITMQALVEANVIKKIKRKYVLNTKIVSAFGSTEKNSMLCIQYGFNTSIVSQKPKEVIKDDTEKYLKYWIF